MADLRITWGDIEGLRRFDNAIKALGSSELPKVAARALNRTGDMSKTQVVRALTKQTGLKRKVIVKAVKVKRSSWRDLEYRMTTRGGDISLKYFGARETRRGASAAPFGKRQVFEGSFIRGGKFPGRSTLVGGGHVFQRVGGERTPIEKLKSGVYIPAEMVKGETAAAFDRTVADVLPRRIEHEISRMTGGAVS